MRDVVVSSARGKLGVSALGGPRRGVAAASRTTRADVGALHSKAPHGHPLVGNSALLGKDDALLLLSRDWACSTCRMLKLGCVGVGCLGGWARVLRRRCWVALCVFVYLCPHAAVIRLRAVPKKKKQRHIARSEREVWKITNTETTDQPAPCARHMTL